MQRKTINQPTTISGTGLFSAQPSTINLHPSPAHTGIIFKHNNQTIPAHINNLSTMPVHQAFAQLKPRCTSVGNDQSNIATIEHILSAITGMGITDIIIEIQSKSQHTEIPILDGSAIEFVRAIEHAGIKALNESIASLVITKPIAVQDPDDEHAFIRIEPANTLSYSYTLDYPQPEIQNATVHWNADRQSYIDLVAPARTFCLKHEADAMHSAGLFTHLKTSDMLVIAESGPLENSLRHQHECALHKLLDLIGDLALVGQSLCAKITANRSGHALAHAAARTIVDQQKNQ